MRRLSLAELRQGLQLAIAERGVDYVDPAAAKGDQCMYVQDRGTENETPGCIIGMAYYKITGELVPEEYELKAAYVTDFDPLEDEAKNLAGWVQNVQDAGRTWGDAVREGQDSYKRAGTIG